MVQSPTIKIKAPFIKTQLTSLGWVKAKAEHLQSLHMEGTAQSSYHPSWQEEEAYPLPLPTHKPPMQVELPHQEVEPQAPLPSQSQQEEEPTNLLLQTLESFAKSVT